MKNKILRLSIFTIFLAFCMWLSKPGTPVQGGHVRGEAFLSLKALESASTESVGSAYNAKSQFLSPVFDAPHEFQLLGLNWQESIPEETYANMEIRFKNKNDKWSDWEHIHTDNDSADHASMEERWSYIVSGESTAFQYRVDMGTSNSSITPKLADINFDYIDGGELSNLKRVSTLSKLIFKSDNKVISRKDWGADESYLYSASSNNLDKYSSEVSDTVKYPDEEIVKKVTTLNGKELLWPLEYPKKVEKIFIHHTVSSQNLDEPDKLMRSIYAYHALTRKWGDIGYNYLIDSKGNVYEGRYGGPSVVAGHTAGYNTGSVGIALMGNFENTAVSAEAMKSLMGLVYEVAEKNGIDPDGSSVFRGKNLPNIMGHKDVSATACPGTMTYDLMPQLIASVGKSLDTRRNMNFDKEFAFESVSGHEMFSAKPETRQSMTIKLKNTGTQTWNKDTILTYDSNKDGVAKMAKDSKNTIAKMKETSVAPGQTATFTFDLESTLKGGMTHFDIAPLFNGTKKTTKYIDLAVYVEPPKIDFSLVSSDLPSSMKSGESKTVSVKIKNSSNFTWYKTGDYPVVLRQSGSSSLSSKSLLANMEEASVAPGQTATFKFSVSAPKTGTKHNLYVYPSLENSKASVSGSISLSTSTSSSGKSTSSSSGDLASIKNMSTDLNFEASQKKYLWIEVQNKSLETWSNKDLNLNFSTSGGLTVESAQMRIKTLPAGASAKIFFRLTAPSKEGSYSVSVMPTLKGKDLIKKAYSFKVEVKGVSVEKTTYENAIRIKLTPNTTINTPVLSSDKNFAVYSGTELLNTYSAGTRIFVGLSNGQYTVNSNKDKFVKIKEIKIVPEESGIVQVVNMSQVPSWNTALNDNKFRGSMEVREENGALILINELSLEDYLKGIGEVSNDAHLEKAKTILVLARSYAYFYMTQAEKFPGKPYHLDDDPDSTQKYLGYGFEARSSKIAEYVKQTEGQVVTYGGKVIKTPYFSESPGYTLSAENKWGWKDTPWLQGVQDPYCAKTAFSGHGVGLSGCGATGMAEAGFTYSDIIKYYYQGIDISTL